jgi:two-component system, LytTR family, response regulator
MPAEAPLRALIVDDEPLARDCVRLSLERSGQAVTVRECGDGATAIALIERERPDLVFLDVQMPGIDGFEVVATVGPERMPPVVMVTAFDEYAVRAFEVHAVDYVLKPFDDRRLAEAVKRVRARRLEHATPDPGDGLRRLLEAVGRYARRIMVREDERIRFVDLADVQWIEAEGNHVRLHLAGTSHLVRIGLAGLADRLDPAAFVRVHRSAILKIAEIAEIQPWFGGDYVAILRSGHRVKISRTFRERVLRVVS